ncbi:MAG TPA: hypothetical protein VJJ98_04960 [Sedimentisphaerales bacterium]|nr:hypothetical protein [Sedimentisphaerales bacterium]
MNKRWWLVAVLRVSGVGMLFALIFVFCPFSWMVRINAWLGMSEELVYTPVANYLIRTLSAMYAIIGSLFILISFDLRRYREIIRFLGTIAIAAGLGITILDAILRLPFLWTALEGPMTIALGAIILYLSRTKRRR